MDHVDYNKIQKIMDRVSQRINDSLKDGDLIIITPNHHTEQDFKKMFKKLKKRKNKFLRSLRKFYGRPYEAIEEFEFIMSQFEVTGVLSEKDVEYQRERFYRELEFPEQTLEFINECKNKGYI